MVTDREAKVWIVAALAVFVWACAMVGCTASGSLASGSSGSKAAGLGGVSAADTGVSLTPAFGEVADPAPLALTITRDAASEWFFAAGDGDGSPGDAPVTWVSELAPAQPDLIRLQPRRMPSNFDAGLSGLSIAHPLLSAKRLLVAGVTQLHRLPRPVNDWMAFDVARADAETRPLAAAVAADQRIEGSAPTLYTPVEFAGPAVEQPAWFIQDVPAVTLPTTPRPAPPPALAAAAAANQAKFDSAGIIGIVLGAMVLLFGGEAIVLLMLNRHQAAVRAELREALEGDSAAALEEDGEVSIFRLPEPVADDAPDAPRSRAA
ncbi:MAG: hypothetical protein AAF333_14780 [Planctomycetota bacterium]